MGAREHGSEGENPGHGEKIRAEGSFLFVIPEIMCPIE